MGMDKTLQKGQTNAWWLSQPQAMHPSSPRGAAFTKHTSTIGATCGEEMVAPAAQPKPLPQGPPARGASMSFVLGYPKGCARHRDSNYHV